MATRGETTRTSKPLPPSKTPTSKTSMMNEDLVEVMRSQAELRNAHEEIVASVIEMKASHEEIVATVIEMKESHQDLAAAVKAIAGQLTDAVQLFQQGQSTVATGSNNNRGEDKKGLEKSTPCAAALPRFYAALFITITAGRYPR